MVNVARGDIRNVDTGTCPLHGVAVVNIVRHPETT
jgi:hypothetical protein